MSDIESQLAALIGPLLEGIPSDHQPAIIALAERIAGQRYRDWAKAVKSEEARSILTACADREDEIATRAEAVVGDVATRVQETTRSAQPELADKYAALFETFSRAEQFGLQARAERSGANLWRALAQGRDGNAEQELLAFAKLEEENADQLQDLMDRGLTD